MTNNLSYETAKRESIYAEFGEVEGAKIWAEHEQIAEHCRANNITHHSVNESGFCNMGCC